MVTIKTQEEIALLREGGKRLATILATVAHEAKAGVSADTLDALAEKLIRDGGDTPAFLNYKGKGDKVGYPASLCVSINDEIVHGIPLKTKVFKEGDIVGLDLGLIHKGLYTDHAVTVAIGTISKEAQQLMDVTKKSLNIAIGVAKPGVKTGDIGVAIEEYVKPFGYGIVEELSGHGVGYEVHEEPFVPNFGVKNQGVELKPGMVIAIEPMFTLGSPKIEIGSDGYAYRSVDGSLAAHFEHTIVITENGSEVLTKA